MAARAARRCSGEPRKNSRSVSTDRAAAPPRSYPAAMRGGSKSRRMRPRLGDARLISAMTAGRSSPIRASIAARKPRGAAHPPPGGAFPRAGPAGCPPRSPLACDRGCGRGCPECRGRSWRRAAVRVRMRVRVRVRIPGEAGPSVHAPARRSCAGAVAGEPESVVRRRGRAEREAGRVGEHEDRFDRRWRPRAHGWPAARAFDTSTRVARVDLAAPLATAPRAASTPSARLAAAPDTWMAAPAFRRAMSRGGPGRSSSNLVHQRRARFGAVHPQRVHLRARPEALEAELLRGHLVLADLAVLELRDEGRRSDADLVETVREW